VKAPFESLLGELDQEYGPFRMFRPYRGHPLLQGQEPVQDAAAASSEGERGTGLYVQVSAAGLMVGSGYYHMASDQLARFREVGRRRRRRRHRDHLRDLEKQGHEIAASSSSRLHHGATPTTRGRPAAAQGAGGDAVLPRGGLGAHRQGEGTGGGTWRDEQPMHDWLDAHVGPSELPPPDAEW
jgi:hypothetical protein